jgi:predicted NAD-dependent protein-ADP-ribosyltransferase YbiA (DUF1768 family)
MRAHLGRPADWFEALFGFRELAVAPPARHQLVHSKISLEGHLLRVDDNGKSFNAGAFSTPSLAELRQTAAGMPPPGDAPPLRIEHLAIDDIFALHSHPDARNAMFQAASQFNCLEMPSPAATPEDGVTNYIHDHTQGPACSLAAGPATVLRNYFCRMPNGQLGQTRDNQLNMLEELLGHLKLTAEDAARLQVAGEDGNALVSVVNGYTDTPVPNTPHGNPGLQHLSKLIRDADRSELRSKLRIGVHSDVDVVFSSRDSHTGECVQIPEGQRQRVSQVFSSAVACGYAHGTPEEWEALARVVLEATYEATLWAAALEQQRGQGSGVVFLTFVGGGVFKNRPEWIQEAIGRACARLHRYPLRVKLCHYKRVDEATAQMVSTIFQSQIPPPPRQRPPPPQAPAVPPAPSRSSPPRGLLVKELPPRLEEPMIYLSARQAEVCLSYPALIPLAPHLPGWVPHRLIGCALGYGTEGIERAVAHLGGRPYVWATELENVHDLWKFHEPGFEVDGVQYPCSEVFYQSQKPRPFNEHAWESRKVGVMSTALRHKFRHSPEALAVLLATHPHPLLSLKRDTVWGFDPARGGENLLARLLESIRQEKIIEGGGHS